MYVILYTAADWATVYMGYTTGAGRPMDSRTGTGVVGSLQVHQSHHEGGNDVLRTLL